MNEQSNPIIDIGKLGFSLLSTKAKLVIIGIAIGIFIVVIFPVVAIMSISSTENKQSNKRKNEGISNAITINEVIDETKLVKYKEAVFPMPFETWDKNRDVITSMFTSSRTLTVNGVVQTGAHNGIDIVCISKGNPKICAVASGKVVLANASLYGYGNCVILEHKSVEGRRFYTLYAHMKHGSIAVVEGKEVKIGQVLGIMGSTGNSTGDHLHFEIRLDNNTTSSCVDPYSYLFGNKEGN